MASELTHCQKGYTSGGVVGATLKFGIFENPRNNARCTKARNTTHGLGGQHQDVDKTLRGRVKIRMTEDRDKWRKYIHGVANPRIENG